MNRDIRDFRYSEAHFLGMIRATLTNGSATGGPEDVVTFNWLAHCTDALTLINGCGERRGRQDFLMRGVLP